MSDLARVGLVLGSVITAVFLPALIIPKTAAGWAKGFSRNRIAGYIIALIDIAWAAWLLHGASFIAELEWAKTLVLVGAPVIYILIVAFMDELLAARAAGGLLLLVPSVLLETAQFHPSQQRLVVTVLAYVFIMLGIITMLSPFRLRQLIGAVCAKNAVLRAAGVCGVLVGGAVIYLAAAVY